MMLIKSILRGYFLLFVLAACSNSTVRTQQITNSFAYISHQYGVIVCEVNTTTGKWSDCQDSGLTTFGNSEQVSFEYATVAFLSVGAQTYAYVANYENGNIYQCLTNPTNGVLSECVFSGIGLGATDPWGIVFYTAQNENTYAYIREAGNNSIVQCPVNITTGQLSACDTLALTFTITNTEPEIVFNTIGGNTYVYLTDGRGVTHCTLTSSGGFTNCNSQTFTNTIDSIALASVGPRVYAYMPNGSVITQCTVSAIDGSLTNCNPILSYMSPYSIAAQSFNNQSFIYMNSSDYYYTALSCEINSANGIIQNCGDSGAGSLFYYPYISFLTITGDVT